MEEMTDPLEVYVPGWTEDAIAERQAANPARHDEWGRWYQELQAKAGITYGGPNYRRSGFRRTGMTRPKEDR